MKKSLSDKVYKTEVLKSMIKTHRPESTQFQFNTTIIYGATHHTPSISSTTNSIVKKSQKEKNHPKSGNQLPKQTFKYVNNQIC